MRLLTLTAAGILLAATGVVALLGLHPAPPAGAPPKRAIISRPVPPRPAPTPTPAPLVVKRVLPIGPIKFGEYHWDENGVPAAGRTVITVDLEAQVLSIFRDGYEIGATAIMYGDEGKPTPLGRFTITERDADHVSNLYGAPMPYMLRLTNDGISIHGSEVAWGYATHGCVGVPVAFAKKLFAATRLGDLVIITRGRTLSTGQPIGA